MDIPRDRQSEFEPVIIKKHQRRFDGFDDAILSLYSRGLSTRDIKAHLEEIYGVEISPDLISAVTEAVIEEVREWQTRPLEAVYPIVYLDALRVKKFIQWQFCYLKKDCITVAASTLLI